MNTTEKPVGRQMSKSEMAERDRLHDRWATMRITKKQIERLESLNAKFRRATDSRFNPSAFGLR